jgi:hypothetical protein
MFDHLSKLAVAHCQDEQIGIDGLLRQSLARRAQRY